MMKKNLLLISFSLLNLHVFSQVGINTDTPNATLDIFGKPTDLAKVDGIIAPRLTGNQLKVKDPLYGNDQNGTFIFATSAASPATAKTVEVTKAGYYYYDSVLAKWVAFQATTGASTTTNVISNPVNTITSTVNGISSTTNAVNTVSNTSATGSNTLSTTINGVTGGTVNLVKTVNNAVTSTNLLTTTVNGIVSTPVTVKNIYNSDGTLVSDRRVTMDGKILSFVGDTGTTVFSNSSDGATIWNIASSGRSDIILGANGSQLQLFSDPFSPGQVNVSGSSTGLSLGTTATTVSAPISFYTSSGSGTNGQNRAEIAGDGRFNIVRSLSIGYSGQQTFTGTQKLKVNGSIVTTGTTYPDYVFQNYYQGSSRLNDNYKFLNLKETEAFLQKNHHLPGVTGINQLEKTKEGYEIDMSKLVIQTLEKVEELYLHIIEQQKQIEELKSKLTTSFK